MARRAEKDNERNGGLGFELDTTPIERPKAVNQVAEQKKPVYANDNVPGDVSVEPVNCLRNERVIVRFVPKQNSLVNTKGHVLYGGMSESAHRSFVVPRLSSTGQYKNVLTNSEKAFLEKAMGLESGALSIYRKENNFWDDSNPNGFGRVTLRKEDNYLDLSNPGDYIKYKILLANSDYIASSLDELENLPKATFQFVIVSESAETTSNLTKIDTIQKCYMEFGKIENDLDTMRAVIEFLEGRPVAARTKADFLKSKIHEWIQRKPKQFLTIVQDELLPAKVLIRKAMDAGLIGKRNDAYYLKQDDTPLCELGEESTLNNAARYISSIRHQELKYTLEAQVKKNDTN